MINLPSNFADKVYDRLKAEEIKYRYIFFDQKNNEIKLVRSSFKLMPECRMYFDYYDGKLFGNHKPFSRAKNWIYIGDLGVAY